MKPPPAEQVYWPYSGKTEFGDCWCTTLYGERGEPVGVRIEQADPRVLISAELLHSFHAGMAFGSLTCAGATCPVGDVFAFNGVNRRVVYVVRRPVEQFNCYVAEWPD